MNTFRKYALALISCIAASLAHAATPAVVGTCATATFPHGATGNTATASVTLANSGDPIIVGSIAGSGVGTASPTMSVSDGTAYTSAVSKNQAYSTNGLVAAIFYLYSASSGSHSIVATNSAGSFNSYGSIWACEVSGLSGSAPVTSSNSSAGSTNPTPGSATPGTAYSIAFSVVSLNDTGNPISFGHPPASYTSVSTLLNGSTTGIGGSADYLIQSGTTNAQNPSYATFTHANAWSSAIAIFSGTAPVISNGMMLNINP